MARRRKPTQDVLDEEQIEMSESTFNPDDYEDIDLTGELIEDMPSVSPTASALSAKEELEEQLLFHAPDEVFTARATTRGQQYGYKNIVGVGISEKQINNSFTGKEAVTVYVVKKASKEKIASECFVPPQINGVPTDVVETGEFSALANDARYRPCWGGVSIGHYQITAGTFGCLVRRGNALYILSNNHVLANVNKGQVNDPIVQPGPFDGGRVPADTIARLSQFVPVNFSGGTNFVDCAIAQTSPSLVLSTIKDYGRIGAGTMQARRFQVVKKSGRTTEFTRGIVTDVNATIRVGFGPSGTAIFQDQILIGAIPYLLPFSAPGDSGSLVVSEFGNQPVGLLFAGSALYTVANKIQNVLSRMNVQIVT